MKQFVCLSAVLAVGCSTAAKDISSAYVSPMQYQGYTCEQLGAEGARIRARTNQLAGRLDEAAREYSRLKGEYDAVRQAAVQKRCPTVVAPPPAAPMQEATAAKPIVTVLPAAGATAPEQQPLDSIPAQRM